MNHETRCYLCGRSESELNDYVAESIRSQQDAKISSVREQLESQKESTEQARKRWRIVVQALNELPQEVVDLKISTVLSDRVVFERKHPSLQEVLGYVLDSNIARHYGYTHSSTLKSAADEIAKAFPPVASTQKLEHELAVLEGQKTLAMNELLQYDNSRLKMQEVTTITLGFGQNRRHSKWGRLVGILESLMKEHHLDLQRALGVVDAVYTARKYLPRSLPPGKRLSQKEWEDAVEQCSVSNELKPFATMDLHKKLETAGLRPDPLPDVREIEHTYYSSGFHVRVPVCPICKNLTEMEIPSG